MCVASKVSWGEGCPTQVTHLLERLQSLFHPFSMFSERLYKYLPAWLQETLCCPQMPALFSTQGLSKCLHCPYFCTLIFPDAHHLIIRKVLLFPFSSQQLWLCSGEIFPFIYLLAQKVLCWYPALVFHFCLWGKYLLMLQLHAVQLQWQSIAH